MAKKKSEVKSKSTNGKTERTVKKTRAKSVKAESSEKPKRVRSAPTKASLQKKNALKRERYAQGEYTVASVYFKRETINKLKKEQDKTGKSRALLIREATEEKYGSAPVKSPRKKSVDKNTRSSDFRGTKEISAKPTKKTKNVKRTRTAKPEV